MRSKKSEYEANIARGGVPSIQLSKLAWMCYIALSEINFGAGLCQPGWTGGPSACLRHDRDDMPRL